MPIKHFLTITPLNSAGRSAVAYVPFVILSRAISFLRFFLVARILGDAGREQYGVYRPALELINPLVALLLFGAADVAERYASRIEHDLGGRGLLRWMSRQWMRLVVAGIAAWVILTTVSCFEGTHLWGTGDLRVPVAAGITMVVLTLYQQLAALLRGLRAFSAAAGMEVMAALLLLVFSVLAARQGKAWTLLVAYGLSVGVPTVVYGGLLRRYLAGAAEVLVTRVEGEAFVTNDRVLTYGGTAPSVISLPLTGFAAWSLVRLILVMLFGFLSLFGVRYLATSVGSDLNGSGVAATADFGMALTLAQLLAYVGVTLWSSSYGLAASAWSRHCRRRARAQFFKVGRLGAALLLVLAVGLLLSRHLVALWLPAAYRTSLVQLLPGLLVVFYWYALLAFSTSYADLQEQPQRGALLWALAVGVLITGIVADGFLPRPQEAGQLMLTVLLCAVGVPLAVSPVVLCRPLKWTASGFPLAVFSLVPLVLLSPERMVDYAAPAVTLAVVIVFALTGWLFRPLDRRWLRTLFKRK